MGKHIYTLHARLDNYPDGAQVPVFVDTKEGYVQAGIGTFDKKNSFIQAEIDTDTEAGAKFADAIALGSLARATVSAHVEVPDYDIGDGDGLD